MKFRVPVICAATLSLGGCAAFNDTVVIDVGEQFRLVESAQTEINGQSVRHGFDCTFGAISDRSGWFGRHRSIEGSVRCVPLDDPAAAP